ncbi:MAG: oligosaccharide flippase family protein [Nanoarchaeota archaeon]|nr:oligosaccharide flippase family protein [Nanoarchaeota archaeon]
MKTIKKIIRKIDSKDKDVENIFRRLKNRDFSGNKGIAIKNSSYQIATTLVAKIGSLLFTIILARLLMPELYGLYGLALSTILFFSVFSDLGIGGAIATFVAKTIDKKAGKAKAYFYYLMKYKIALFFMSSLIIILSANFIANIYYQKPIFYALLAGAIYFPITYLSKFLGLIFVAKNNFKIDFFGEIILQVTRLTIMPLLIIYLLSLSISSEILLLWIFIGLSVCFFITGIFYFTYYFSNNPFYKVKKEKLSSIEKKELWIFTFPLALTAFSGLFFGYIDIIILGHYVDSEFIGFYQVAFNLIAAASTIIGFSAGALFPIFLRLKGSKLDIGLRKARKITFLISILALIFTFIMAPFLVSLIYGDAYSESILYLRIFSLLLISFPMIGLYQIYFMSQKRTKVISVLLAMSTVINISLNFIFINIGLRYGMKEAVLGVCIATIISRYFYLAGLMLWKKIRG